MDRRVFIKSAGLLSVGLLTGCGGGNTSGTGTPGAAGYAPATDSGLALLRIKFDELPTARKSVLPVGTDLLVLRGYDVQGAVVYGPEQVAPPPSNVLELQVPVTLATLEIVGLGPQPQ